jgi:hypothetical protein
MVRIYLIEAQESTASAFTICTIRKNVNIKNICNDINKALDEDGDGNLRE